MNDITRRELNTHDLVDWSMDIVVKLDVILGAEFPSGPG